MPVNRAILADIAEKNLDPTVAWTKFGKDGKLKNVASKLEEKETNLQVNAQAVQIVDVAESTIEQLTPSPIIEISVQKSEEPVEVKDETATEQKKGKFGRKKKSAEGDSV